MMPLKWKHQVCYAKVTKAGYDCCLHETLLLFCCLHQYYSCCCYCDLAGANSRCIMNSLCDRP
ncbi:Uncharacterized protein APZ42_022912 [Daphnia magna]|uniref:Uncharacterized protein n=1 Tax=Daphnia magna TaxID=35525 RepID=A0A164VXF7_9CRUS|nr:Uncharacterized protein APZ42_022912 [Daphnia magna]